VQRTDTRIARLTLGLTAGEGKGERRGKGGGAGFTPTRYQDTDTGSKGLWLEITAIHVCLVSPHSCAERGRDQIKHVHVHVMSSVGRITIGGPILFDGKLPRARMGPKAVQSYMDILWPV